MKKRISAMVLVSLCTTGSAMASGFRIPEQSLDSTAKSGANIASASSADAAYYNPAGMAFLEDTWHLEGTGTYLHLTSIDYDDHRTGSFDGSSKKENFFLPTFFVVSPDYNNFRFGFAVVEPYGLQKRWDDAYPQAFAEKFSLKVFEFNPTVSYKFNDMISIAGGARMLYSKATVMQNSLDVQGVSGHTLHVHDSSTDWGYNLAVDVRPTDNWNMALTYRSKVDLTYDGGDVDFTMPNLPPPYGGPVYVSTTGSVEVPAPAVLAFSTAYTYEKWTVDLTVDRTYWSKYKDLRFNFDRPLTNPEPTDKEWNDTTAIRLGLEYQLDPRLTLMGGVAYDQNPVPNYTIGFELPDSDAWLFSGGVRFKQNDNLEYGVAVLYDYKRSRDANSSDDGGNVNGKFTNASALLVSLGVSYMF
ncbi:MAG: OmpP1/FadL family transporter [Desulfopila sp.]